MAGRRVRTGRAAANRKSVVGRRRPKERNADVEDEVSRTYREMLSEAAASPASADDGKRPVKKRKVASGDSPVPAQNPVGSVDSQNVAESQGERRGIQTAFDDSSSSDASDMDWEEVELNEEQKDEQDAEAANEMSTAADDAVKKDISIDLTRLAETPTKPKTTRRLPSSVIEKNKRIQIHKMHLCCLLAHVYIRNCWCNDQRVQAVLKPLLSRKQISYLNPDPSLSQFQRSRSFVDGLEQACEAFRPAYDIYAKGLKKPMWATSLDEAEKHRGTADEGERIDMDGFLKLAQDRKGSRDAGAQLFCALLRSAGVDSRLVCSLQCLPFAAAAPVPTQRFSDLKPTIVLRGNDNAQSADEMSSSDSGSPSVQHANLNVNGLEPVKRFGASGASTMHLGVPPPSIGKRKRFVESHYPVYWVEAFNSALQKWLPVDPLVTKTVARPKKFEPPASDAANDLTYVVAFEDDGTAKDVTRRYAKAYNAKTRKSRVEATRGGENWWKKVMQLFDHGLEADRDQVEDAELAQKEAAEPMPRNVQDFKDHPYYALERHLRRNEVIHPRKEVGKFSGTGKASDSVEPIYRRRDVQTVKSADRWFRSGREIKTGEQPLKYSNTSRRQRPRSVSPASGDDQDDADRSVGLYAEFQTNVHVPPPVAGGRVPRNAFGNLDVYVPSMIPPGGAHVRAAEAAKAAHIVGVDYADAVTGFKFKGRRGTAVTQGIIVAKEFAEAIEETVLGLRWADEMAAHDKRSRMAMALWKRFLVGLRIRERVMNYGGGEEDEAEAIAQEEEMEGEGGFLPDRATASLVEHGRTKFETDLLDADEAALAINLDDAANEQRPQLDNRPMCIPSPWDDRILSSRSNRPSKRETPQRGETSDEQVADDFRNNQYDSTQVVTMTEFQDGGGGGFILPTASSEVADGRRGTGDFAVPTQSEPGTPLPTEQNPAEQIAPVGIPKQASDGPGVRHVGDDRPSTSNTDQTDETGEVGQVSYSIDQKHVAVAEAGHGENREQQGPRARSQGLGSDQESLLSHDPEDEDAEPDWLAG